MVAKTIAAAVMHYGHGRHYQEDGCLIFDEILPAESKPDPGHRTAESAHLAENGMPDGKILEKKGSSERPLQLYAVADGMGGHGIGDLAARVALASLREDIEIYQNRSGRRIMDFAELAECVSDDVDQAVRQQLTAWQGMPVGAALSWLMIENDAAYTMSTGQGRIYLFRQNKLYCMTRDSVKQPGKRPELYFGFRPREGRLMPENLNRLPLERGDLILLTSDGITSVLSDSEIETVLRSPDAFVNQVRSLLDLALSAGGSDNMTAIAIRVLSLENILTTDEKPASIPGIHHHGKSRPKSDGASWLERLRDRIRH